MPPLVLLLGCLQPVCCSLRATLVLRTREGTGLHFAAFKYASIINESLLQETPQSNATKQQ